MKSNLIKTDFRCKRFILKYIGPLTGRERREDLNSKYVSVFLNGFVLGMVISWPAVNVQTLISRNSPIPMTKTDISWMMTLYYFAGLVSPVPTGYLADKYGRKTVLLCFNILPIVTWSLVSVGTHRYHLWVSWFCAGLWTSSLHTTIPVYLGEIATPKYRGLLNTMATVTRRLGVILQLILCAYIPFKTMSVIALVIIVTSTLITTVIPESPHYYLIKKDRPSARKSLQKLRGNNEAKAIEDELNELDISVQEHMENSGRFKDLITIKSNRRILFITVTIIILTRLSEIGAIMAYIVITLPKTIVLTFTPFHCILIIEIVRLLAGFLSSMVIDKLSRKTLMTSSSIVCGVSMLVTGFWYYLNARKFDMSNFNWIILACLVVHNSSQCFGLSPVCSTLISEYFPINVKGKLAAIASITFALVSCIVSKTFLATTDYIGTYFNYWIFSIACFLNAIFTMAFVIETKGKTLKQIQDELKNMSTKPRTSHDVV